MRAIDSSSPQFALISNFDSEEENHILITDRGDKRAYRNTWKFERKPTAMQRIVFA
jgi:hypothetical protein